MPTQKTGTFDSTRDAVTKRCGQASSGRRWALDLLNCLHEAQQTPLRPLSIGKNGGAGYYHIRSSLHRQWGCQEVDSAIDLQLTVRVALLQ